VNCKDLLGNYQAFLDRQLDAALSKQIAQHLKECPVCAEFADSERTFHNLLKNAFGRGEVAAPTHLRERLQASLRAPTAEKSSGGGDGQAQSAAFAPLGARIFYRYAHGPLATAAAVLIILAAIVFIETRCLRGECRMVLAAHQEHANINAGARTMLPVKSFNEVSAFLHSRFPHFGGLPDLSRRRLYPALYCQIKLREYAGVCVQFTDGEGGTERLSLMIVDSAEDPSVPKQNGFFTATHLDHSIVSWRNDADGLLYMLVSKCPLSEALSVAEMARK
jgi:mycothiol system anti-sigma-R factor